MKLDLLERNPCADIGFVPEPTAKAYVPSAADVRRLLLAAPCAGSSSKAADETTNAPRATGLLAPGVRWGWERSGLRGRARRSLAAGLGGVIRSIAAAVIGLSILALAWLPGCRSWRHGSLRVEAPVSVVFILIDTLRADRTSLAGYQRDTTPNLATLSSESVVFEQAFSSAPSTIPSVPQMFTSSYFPAFQGRRTLAAVIEEAGASSLAVVNNPWAGNWISALEPGFGELAHGAFAADEITDRALAWLDANATRPLALYLHYLEPHTPYEAPPAYADRFIDPSYRGPIGLTFNKPGMVVDPSFTDADRRRIGDLYDGNVLYVDAALGRLFDGLRKRGVLDDAIVVVTADHGEELWDHDGYFHGHSLYDELLHVPLLVRFPRAWRAGTRVQAAVQTIDVLPSIADVLIRAGAPSSLRDGRWAGRSLVALLEDGPGESRTLLSTVGRPNERKPPRHAVRYDGYKYIATQSDGREELYEPARDAAERHDLSATHPEVLERGRAELYALTEPLRTAGVHVELANDGDHGVDYRVTIRARPAAPFVNLHRLTMDRGDRVDPGVRTDGVVLSGELGAGDRDRMRFDLMRADGMLVIDARIDGAPLATDRIAVGGAGVALDGAVPRYPIVDLLHAGRPEVESDDGVGLSVWSAGKPLSIPNKPLTDAEQRRLRALGYLR